MNAHATIEADARDDEAVAGNAIVTRATIDEIVGHRRRALDLFAQAREILAAAMDAAARSAGGVAPHLDDRTTARAFSARDGDAFLDGMRRQIDARAWHHLVMGYGFEKLMDRQAMEEFRAQLDRDPPELDADVAEATMLKLMGDADMLLRRGVANAFSKLDRRFRSHDGFKLGSRVVLDHAFSADTGSWNHYARRDETLRDVERAFHRLDGRETPERYAGIVGAIDAERSGSFRAKSFQAETDLFRVKVFKNGNAHLWFRRDDLLAKVNRLLAEHYGEVLGADSDALDGDPFDAFRDPRTDLARNMGWFPTPAAVADRVVADAEIVYARSYRPDGDGTLRILEPSAGEGAIAVRAVDAMLDGPMRPLVTCVELHPDRAEALRRAGFVEANGHRTLERDFMACTPDELGLFDHVLMNPPFDLQRDVDHVVHAIRFLKPGGRLVAITSAGVAFRENRKATAFREIVERMGGDIRDLPPGSFEESGTMVNTCIVTLRAPRC